MSAEFVFMDDNARPHRANIVCLQSEDITRMEWPPFSPDLSMCGTCLADELQNVNHVLHMYWNFGELCLLSGVIFLNR